MKTAINPFIEFFEQSHDYFWTIDSELNITYANESYKRAVRSFSGKILNIGDLAIIEDFGDAFVKKWRECYARALSGETFEVQANLLNPIYHKNECGIVRFNPVKDDKGIVSGVACHTRDLSSTSRINDEAEKIMDASLDVICSINKEGNFIKVSAACKALWGYEKHEMIGKAYIDFVLEEDREKTNFASRELLGGKKLTTFENRYKRKDGGIAYNLWSAQYDPKTRNIFSVARDAREKIKKEELLLENEERFKTLVQEGSDLIAIIDEDGIYTYVSPTTIGILGIYPEAFLGKSVFDFIHPNDIEKTRYSLSQIRSKDRLVVEPFRFQNKKGEWRWIETVLTNMLKNPSIGGIVTNSRDITEKKNHEIAKDLTSKISSLLNEEPDLNSALNKLCEEVSILGKFSFCEIWITDIQEKFLELKAFNKGDKAGEIFYENSKRVKVFEKGQGVPGSIWENNESIIWENKGENHDLLVRSRVAEMAGIKTIVGFPLIYHEKFIGVLMFGNPSEIKHIKWVLNILKELGLFIGAEIARKKTETIVSRVFEFAPDIIAMAGFDGFFKTVNPYMCQLLDFTEKELTSKPFTAFIHPSDVDKTIKELQKISLGAPSFNFRNRYFTKTGDIKTISWNSSPANEDGLLFCVGKDVSKEVRATDLLSAANKLSRFGSWEVDMINQTIYWSEMTFEIHEAEKDFQLNFREAIAFYRPDYQEYVKSVIDNSLKSGMPFDFEAILVTAKNNEIWVRSIGIPEIVNGKCTRLYGSIQDINQKKSTEIRLNSIANNLPGAIFQYQLFPDGTDRLLHLSKGAEKLWEIDAEKGMKNIGLIWDQVRNGGDMEIMRASIAESRDFLTDWHMNFRSKLPNGKIKWLEGLGTPRNLADGSTVWDSIILDVTRLKETEELLASASKLARVGSWEMNVQKNKAYRIFWSPITKEIFEVDSSIEISLDYGLSMYKEHSRSKIDRATNKLIQTGQKFDLELNLVTAKGNNKWIRCIGNAEMNKGKVTRVYGSIQDIHSRKSAELNQKKLLEEKNKILESIGDGFFAVDRNWNITYWNRSAEVVLGKKRDDMVGKNLWKEYHLSINSEIYSKYHHAMKTMETVSFEIFRNSSNRWMSVTAYPSADGLSVFFKDITSKKEFDLKIQEANERFEKVAEATADAIWDWDIINDKYYRGKGFKELFGYEWNNALNQGKFSEKYFDKKELAEIKKSVDNALSDPQKNSWEFKYKITHSSGIKKTVLDKGVILRDSSGKAIRMIGAIKDISYIINHEKELMDLNRILKKNLSELKNAYEELEQFTYIASHDLQEPLRMVNSFMALLKKKYGKNIDEKGHQYIDFATDGAKRMKQIILDLLEYSRAGKIKEEPVTIDPNQILKEYKILRRKVIAEKKVVFRAGKLPVLYTSRTPFIQILHNLLDNAIKYTKEDIQPVIFLSSKERRDFWELCIEDNGIGIDSKHFDKIFIMFQRLHGRDEYSGTGIGLSIVKKQIESLGGNIWLESDVNIGSKFYFTIPK